jgi:hypothetical protein
VELGRRKRAVDDSRRQSRQTEAGPNLSMQGASLFGERRGQLRAAEQVGAVEGSRLLAERAGVVDPRLRGSRKAVTAKVEGHVSQVGRGRVLEVLAAALEAVVGQPVDRAGSKVTFGVGLHSSAHSRPPLLFRAAVNGGEVQAVLEGQGREPFERLEVGEGRQGLAELSKVLEVPEEVQGIPLGNNL